MRAAEALAAALAEGVRADGVSWRVARAWPAAFDDPTAGHVLELVAEDGDVRGALLRDGVVSTGPDAALPALAGLVAEGWTVLAHRFGKRAVLRRDGMGVFRKLATPKATRRAVERADEVDRALGALPVPRPPARVGADIAAGTIDLAPAPGLALRSVLTDPATTVTDARSIGRRIGELLGRLTMVAPGGGLPEHSATDEAEVLARWVTAACESAPLTPDVAARLRAEADAVIGELLRCERAPTLAHRDLHDGQILVAPGDLTVLDWDTAAWADPCLDVGNLLAHLDLLVQRVPVATDRVAALTAGLLEVLGTHDHPAATDPAGLALWRRSSAVRIRAVHAFRPATVGDPG
ncbi:phosphotransferase family protein [Granulicoccus sp. GXG6511]|uniref:phosphotransferase family protein n=1 Tax=Granulicoccus sp. GXG6511 TaxID=3381351 RepID=UPI003D7DCFE4